MITTTNITLDVASCNEARGSSFRFESDSWPTQSGLAQRAIANKGEQRFTAGDARCHLVTKRGTNRRRLTRLTVSSYLCALGLLACSHEQSPQYSQGATGSSAPFTTSKERSQRWRLAANHELSRTVVWCAHLLIRHRDAEQRQAPLVVPEWHVLPPSSTRSREEAYQLAAELERDLHAAPEKFATLAATHSEDPTTRDRGGSMGGIAISNLLLWPEVVDEVASLDADEVSRVVESPWGFHVFIRRAAPTRELLAARRLVVGYREAGWLAYNERSNKRGWRSRSREDAWSLAEQLSDELVAHPEEFEARARESSEHWDATQGGDVGVWSSLEPSVHARAFESLRQLPIGGVTKPIDTWFGVSVWQRTEPRTRAAFAADIVRFRYDVDGASDETSKKSAEQRARDVLRTIRTTPRSFDDQERAGNVEHLSWTEGRGVSGLEAAISTIAVGAIADVVVDTGSALLVAKRVEPTDDNAPLEPLIEIPLPEQPDLPCHLARLSTQSRAAILTAAAANGHALEGFGAAEVKHFEDSTARLAQTLSTLDADRDRCTAVASYLTHLRFRLGGDAFNRMETSLQQTLGKELMP